MELAKQSFKIEQISGSSGFDMLFNIEAAGRTCYKSEDNNPDGNLQETEKFVERIIRSGHHSVLEHSSMTVRFITNRGCTHELVRHRLAAYSQESTRYCNYGNGHVKFIIPQWIKLISPGTFVMDDLETIKCPKHEKLWMDHMLWSERTYKKLLSGDVPPQFARGVLPIDLKTEIVMTANLREWMHVFSLRCAPAAHPQIRELMLGLLKECHKQIPVIFDNLAAEYLEK